LLLISGVRFFTSRILGVLLFTGEEDVEFKTETTHTGVITAGSTLNFRFACCIKAGGCREMESGSAETKDGASFSFASETRAIELSGDGPDEMTLSLCNKSDGQTCFSATACCFSAFCRSSCKRQRRSSSSSRSTESSAVSWVASTCRTAWSSEFCITTSIADISACFCKMHDSTGATLAETTDGLFLESSKTATKSCRTRRRGASFWFAVNASNAKIVSPQLIRNLGTLQCSHDKFK